MARREAQMIAPIKRLLYDQMSVDIAEQEFTAGYGIADVVGAKFCNESCQQRENLGLAIPFDHFHLINVLLSLHTHRWTPLENLLKKVAISESTLRTRVLPRLIKLNTIERKDDNFRRGIYVPKPTKELIAVEAKQTKWKEAILQARRYGYFADQSYIAVWDSTIKSVDRSLLYRHRVGLITVFEEKAEIVIEAPMRIPREPKMQFYSAEFFYGMRLKTFELGKTD